jgi:hypothetical protein
MKAMFSLLFRFWPRRNAGAPAMKAVVATVRPTNSRRVIGRGGGIFVEGFMELALQR